ncbi:MAG: hypothetical protein AAGI91_17130 [Bacteroidota bacterium]
MSPDRLLRYLRGDASLDERRSVDTWIDADPAHRGALDIVLRQAALDRIDGVARPTGALLRPSQTVGSAQVSASPGSSPS